MIITPINEQLIKLRWASPAWDMTNKRVYITLSEIMQLKAGEAWNSIPETMKESYKSVNYYDSIHFVDPETLIVSETQEFNNDAVIDSIGNVVTPATPKTLSFFTWLGTLTASDCGMTSLEDKILSAMANKVEQILTVNNQWD